MMEQYLGTACMCRRQAFQELAKASKYAVAVMPDGKGMYPEDDESFVGMLTRCCPQ